MTFELLKLYCFNINGECVMTTTATIISYLPLIALAVFIISYLISRKIKEKQEDEEC